MLLYIRTRGSYLRPTLLWSWTWFWTEIITRWFPSHDSCFHPYCWKTRGILTEMACSVSRSGLWMALITKAWGSGPMLIDSLYFKKKMMILVAYVWRFKIVKVWSEVKLELRAYVSLTPSDPYPSCHLNQSCIIFKMAVGGNALIYIWSFFVGCILILTFPIISSWSFLYWHIWLEKVIVLQR